MTKQFMNQTEYAKHRGVTEARIRRAIQDGLIECTDVHGKKFINVAKADESWEHYIDPTLRRTPVAEVKTKAPPFQESRAVREAYAARIAKIDYEQRAKKLVAVDLVEKRAHHTAAIIKNHLNQLPAKVAAELAAETDALEIEKILTREIDESLNELSNYVRNAATTG